MAVGDKCNQKPVVGSFEENIPGGVLIGFIEDIFGTKARKLFRSLFCRENREIVFDEIIDLLNIIFCRFFKSKILVFVQNKNEFI